MGIFNAIRQRREQKRRLRELRAFASVFSTFDRLVASAMLVWKPRERQLIIAEPLAQLMMRDAESWENFIRNLFLYTYQQTAQQEWDAYFQREELAAVRRAAKEAPAGKKLSREDIDRIKRARRAEIAQSDMPAPKVQPFEFYIVRETTDAVGKLIAVGWFDPETERQELAPWSEVEPLLRDAAEAKKK